MRTNALHILLLAAVVACVMGCGTTQQDEQKLDDWQSRIPGSYKSVIFNGETGYAAKTTFKSDKDKLSGTYELDHDGITITGELRKFSVTGDRKLKCRWLDDESREGNFNLTFSADMSNFKGHWDRDDGDGNGAWNGGKK